MLHALIFVNQPLCFVLQLLNGSMMSSSTKHTLIKMREQPYHGLWFEPH